MNIVSFIANNGFVTQHIAQKYMNVSAFKLNKYVKNNILEKNKYILFSQIQEIYTLSAKTLNDLRKKNVPIYKSDFNQLEHDYLLGKVYLSLLTEEQLSWKNETALKLKFGKLATTCDAMYISKDKLLIGVEILTSSYKKNTIEEKKIFMKNNCDKSIILHTKDFNRRI